jgi:ATP-dependent Clp protease ATP-binding subunit ClpX
MAKRKPPHDHDQDNCSFCGRSGVQVDRLIAGPPSVFICNECVQVCSSLLENDSGRRRNSHAASTLNLKNLPIPRQIKENLDRYIIGQEHAKRTMSVAVYNHYKRLCSDQFDIDVELDKSNVLMLGPTGCGKTAIASTMARMLNVPFAIGDATTITEAGYVGEDVENLLLRLIQAADNDIERAETGILYIDEIDKIARSSGNVSITRDVSGEGVQQSLLKLIEGTLSNVPPGGGRKHPEQKYLQINTRSILFICGGAFSGLNEIIKRRLGDRVVGFRIDGQQRAREDEPEDDDESWFLAQVQPEDLIEFGLIPEFVGRLPIVTALEQLDEDALVTILTEPHNALVKQYQALFSMDGVDLAFTDEALRCIAHRAMQRKTGARALRSIMEDVMLDIMFDLPQEQRSQTRRHVTITEAVVNGDETPQVSIVPSRSKAGA